MGQGDDAARADRGRAERAARRKLRNLLEGRFLLYELTGDRERHVLRLPRPLMPRGGSGDRACPREGGGGPPAG